MPVMRYSYLERIFAPSKSRSWFLIGWNEVQDTVENTDRYSTVKNEVYALGRP